MILKSITNLLTASLVLAVTARGVTTEALASADVMRNSVQVQSGVRAGVVCTNAMFDYGTISATSTVSHAFGLLNMGTNRVTITRIRSGCGCVATVADKRVLEPGDHSEIKVKLSMRGRSGVQRKVVYVHTDSKVTPLLRLDTKGIVKRVAVKSHASIAARRDRASLKARRLATASGQQKPGISATPSEVRLPSTVGSRGVVTFVAIRDDKGREFSIESVTFPLSIPHSEKQIGDGFVIKLGPIPNPTALDGEDLVVLTSLGQLTIPCRVVTR